MTQDARQIIVTERLKMISGILMRKYGGTINEADIEKIIGTRLYAGRRKNFILVDGMHVIETQKLAKYIASSKARSVRFYLTFVPPEDLPTSYETASMSGYPVYLPAKPCGRGHAYPRSVWTRQCLSCYPVKLANKMIEANTGGDSHE